MRKAIGMWPSDKDTLKNDYLRAIWKFKVASEWMVEPPVVITGGPAIDFIETVIGIDDVDTELE